MMNASKPRTGSYKHGIVLACFAIIVTTLLAATQWLTKGQILDNEKAQIQNALAEVLPDDTYDHPLQDYAVVLFDQQAQKKRTCYVISKQGTPVATIITAVAPDGYSGNIEMLIGILADGTVSGVRVTKHTETPGLGDAIEIYRSNWIKSFDGKSLTAPLESRWAVKKHNGEFDQFTGATITPRAVINEVKNTLRFFNSVKPQLFKL